MAPVARVDATGADPCAGRVRLDPFKAAWNGGMIGASLLAPFFVSVSAVLLFAVLTYATLLLGHSVGMHRMMIHRTFRAGPGLRRGLILLGVIVGMGGPSRIIRIHDMRDWAQRQPDCHDFFSHRRGFIRDVAWQLFCRFDFERAPAVHVESEIADDPVMAWLDRGWWAVQLALAAGLFAVGGLAWVMWGVCLRVAVSTVGHWSVTYLCHNPGPGRWHVRGAGVQASDLPGWAWVTGVLTHGECWHSNHHAFPESARVGLERGQVDPAAAVIEAMERRGWVWDVGVPRHAAAREDLVRRAQPGALAPVPSP